MAGKQGSPRMGEVAVARSLPPNEDLMAAKSYSLDHRRAGTVSLNLSHNEDDPLIQNTLSYRNVSFLITTGEGTALQARLSADAAFSDRRSLENQSGRLLAFEAFPERAFEAERLLFRRLAGLLPLSNNEKKTDCVVLNGSLRPLLTVAVSVLPVLRTVWAAGPGPATALDGTNVVFGKVLQGMDTISRVTGELLGLLCTLHCHTPPTKKERPTFLGLKVHYRNAFGRQAMCLASRFSE